MKVTTSPRPGPFEAHRCLWRPDTGFEEPLPVHLDGDKTLVLAFADTGLGGADGPVAGLQRAFPRSVVLACSSAGEISEDLVELGTLCGIIMRFQHGDVRWARADVDGRPVYAAGLELAAALAADDLKGVFLVSDGLAVNGSELTRGLVDGLPDGVHVAGGLAGDRERFGQTWVAAGGPGQPGVVAAVGLYGDAVEVGVGTAGGWSSFGPGRAVTRSEGNVLYELDGEPAVPLYRAYLGDFAASLPGSALLFPLSVACGDGEGAVVRTVLAIDDEEGSMTFAGDVAAGGVAHLMTSTLDQLSEAAGEAASAAVAALSPGAGQVAVLAVSCVGRRLAMGQRIDDELAAAQEHLPAGSVQVGFYSYGEIGPGAAGRCCLHNQTMTVMAVSERGA